MIHPGFSAEFPNDNPLLWSALERESQRETEPEPLFEPEALDDYARFVAALVTIAELRGATRAAALLPGLLGGERVVAEGVPAALQTLEFRLAARAWRGALAGSSDLSECGDAPLDEWAADVLATLFEAPAERAALRRELRAHGVAAFGLLAA